MSERRASPRTFDPWMAEPRPMPLPLFLLACAAGPAAWAAVAYLLLFFGG